MITESQRRFMEVYDIKDTVALHDSSIYGSIYLPCWFVNVPHKGGKALVLLGAVILKESVQVPSVPTDVTNVSKSSRNWQISANRYLLVNANTWDLYSNLTCVQRCHSIWTTSSCRISCRIIRGLDISAVLGCLWTAGVDPKVIW